MTLTSKGKRSLLLLLSAALLSILLLSSGLSNLQLEAGVPFPAVRPQNTATGSGARQGYVLSFSFLQGLLGLLLLLLMFYVPARLILFVKVKWLLRVIQILVILLIAAVLFSLIRFDTACSAGDCPGTGMIPAPIAPVTPANVPPPGILYVLGIGLALTAAFLLIRSLRMRHTSGQDLVLQHAENAVQAIQAGKDFSNVVVQCYSRMAAALDEEQGIERSASMTSREFETLLASRGFPPAPVHELTHLFEKARYSREDLRKSDEIQAVDSLNAIIDFVKGGSHG